MRRMRLVSVAASLLVLSAVVLAAAPAQAQAWAGKGRLQGSIKDEQGKPVQGATITLRKGTDRVDAKADGPKPLLTDKNGKWSILGLAGGAWGILIEKEGFIPSEGQIKVDEFAVAQPLNLVLKVIPKEAIEQAQRQSEAQTGVGLAKAALERGNALLGEARPPGGTPDKAKLAQARAAYQEGLDKLAEAKLDDPEVQKAVEATRLSVYQTVAGIDYELGKTDEAIAMLKQVLVGKPDDAGVIQLLVNLLVQAGKEEEAKQYMAKLPEGAKVDADTVLNMGIKAFNDGQMDKAFAAFDRAVKENPERADAYYYRGLIYLNKSKNAEAKADFNKYLQLDPNDTYHHVDDTKAFLKDMK
jgi:tetratricopeptide (TPR) repeat protein